MTIERGAAIIQELYLQFVYDASIIGNIYRIIQRYSLVPLPIVKVCLHIAESQRAAGIDN